MDYSFSKYKLPRGQSYPLKRSVLDAALDGLRDGAVYQVGYMRQASDLVLWALFSGETRRAFTAGTTSIYVYAVASTERKQVESALADTGLIQLRQWLDRAESKGNVWRATDHGFVLRWREDRLYDCHD